MFGTGIPGFAIITSITGALTYLVTFGLLKSEVGKNWLRKLWTKEG
jgi:hypothetical protein